MFVEKFNESTFPIVNSNNLLRYKSVLTSKTIKFKHYSISDFSNCIIKEITTSYITAIFPNSCQQLNILPQDPIILSISEDNEIYRISGEVLSINSLDPIEIIIEIFKIETRDNLRKNERFSVSLEGNLITLDNTPPNFAIVKNISEKGFKLKSKKDIEINEIVSFSTVLDSLYKISCKTKILRKKYIDNFFVYGVKITDISNEDETILKDFLKKLKIGILK